MIPVEASQNDAWPKAPCRIEASTRKICPRKHSDKQRQAESDRCDKRGPLFFYGQEENGEDEEDGEKHLDEQALRDGGAAAKGGTYGQGSRKECAGNGGGDDAAKKLYEDEESTTQGRHSPDEYKPESDLCVSTVKSL